MADLFKCSICNSLDDNIYESECCGIIFCSECHLNQKNIKDEKCKRCGNLLNCHFNNFAKRMVQSFKVKCKYDCGKICQFQDMKPHLTCCPNKEYKCTFDKCSFTGKKTLLMKHLIISHDLYLLCLMENMNDFEGTVINQKKKEEMKEDNQPLFNFGNDYFPQSDYDVLDLIRPNRQEREDYRNVVSSADSRDDTPVISPLNTPPPLNTRFNIERNHIFKNLPPLKINTSEDEDSIQSNVSKSQSRKQSTNTNEFNQYDELNFEDRFSNQS